MPNLNISFGGATIVKPGVYYVDNVSNVTSAGTSTLPPVVFVGNGYGLQPQVPYAFNDEQSLITALRGGPAAKLVPFLFAPSAQVNGATSVTFINAAENTQSTLGLLASGSTTVKPLTLSSANYGLPSNMLTVVVNFGSLALNAALVGAVPTTLAYGNRSVLITDGYSGQSLFGDNLGTPFGISYSGTATGVTYAVGGTPGAATSLSIVSPNAVENVTISIGAGGYNKIADIVSFLNGTGFYTASTYSDDQMPATYLDITPATVIAKGPAVSYLTAMLSGVYHWVSTVASGMATCSLPATGVAASGIALVPGANFTGGTNVPPLLVDYANALNVALNIPGWVVIADSNTAGVAQLGAQHAVLASSVTNRRPRRFVTGAALGEPLATSLANSRSLNAIQASYAVNGIYRNDPVTGVSTLYSALFCAAAYAGMMQGNSPALPLTNKNLTGNGVEAILSTTQIDQYQQGGCLVLYRDDNTGLPVIATDFTSWQTDSNPENVFNQQVACRQFLEYQLLQAGGPYVGGIAAPYSITLVRNAVVARLNSLLIDAFGNGVLSSWDSASLLFVYDGPNQALRVSVRVVFVGQFRAILISATVQNISLVLQG